jgi:hypothetical protein
MISFETIPVAIASKRVGEVGVFEVSFRERGVGEVGVGEVGITKVRSHLGVIFTPFVPDLNALF